MGENSNIFARSEQGDKGNFNLKIFKPRFPPCLGCFLWKSPALNYFPILHIIGKIVRGS